MSKLNLPQVTLIAFGGLNIEGMRKALEYSSKDINFGEVKLVEHTCESIDVWNRHIVFDLGDYVKTEFALLIHPDGFVVNADAWNPDFLNYDYIGAPWPLPTDNYSYRDIHGNIVRVGNSVSLRSRKLLDLPKKLNLEWKSYYGNTNEDGFICCHNKHILEENGCKFAPFELALQFGREVPLPENKGLKTFTFHKNASENSVYPCFED